MLSVKEDVIWNVLLRGEVRACMTKVLTFDETINTSDMATDEARFADHTGKWSVISEPAIVIEVENEMALQNTGIVKIREIELGTWEAAFESTVLIRSVVCVEAESAHEAMTSASMELPPAHWQIDGVDSKHGAEVFVGSGDVFGSVYASACSALSPD